MRIDFMSSDFQRFYIGDAVLDLIQVFKIIENIDDVSMNGLFEFCDSQTRGHR